MMIIEASETSRHKTEMVAFTTPCVQVYVFDTALVFHRALLKFVMDTKNMAIKIVKCTSKFPFFRSLVTFRQAFQK